MAISPTCRHCERELSDFGGILLGPPEADGRVVKDHLCLACYRGLCEYLDTSSKMLRMLALDPPPPRTRPKSK